MTTRSEECCWKDCEAKADAEICAQWTIFDFDSWACCLEHQQRMFSVIARKRVDGLPPAELYTKWYW
jgi:hypothetical protein